MKKLFSTQINLYALLKHGLLTLSLCLIILCITSPQAFGSDKNLFSVRGIGGGGGFFIPVFSPYNKDLYFTVCDMGGVYRSTNAGKSWEMLNWRTSPRQAHYKPLPIFLTKERIAWVSWRNTIRISEDEGKTWKNVAGAPWYKEKATVEGDKRKNFITSFLALDELGKDFLVSSDFGLWRGGNNSWKKIMDKPIKHLNKIGNDIYCVENEDSLLKSSDNGKTWTSQKLPGKITAIDGTITEKGETLFYIGIPKQGLLSSTDFGKNWKVQTDEVRKIRDIEIPDGQSSIVYASEFFVDYNAEPANFLRSLDGGETWEKKFIMHDSQEKFWQEKNVEISWLQSNLYWSYYITGITSSPFDPKLLMLTTQGELFISRDGGDSWQIFFSERFPALEAGEPVRNKSIGLEVTSVWGYYFDPHDAKRDYIAYTDIGFARSADSGETWTWSAQGSPWKNTFYDVAFDPDIAGKIYSASSNLHDIPHFLSISIVNPKARLHQGGVVVSTDFGKTWKVPYNRKASNALPAQITTAIAIDPSSSPENRTLFAGLFGESDDTAGVYVSHDDGKTWAPTKGQPGGYNRHIYKLAFHPKTGDLYCLITGLRAKKPNYFNKDEGGLWKSSDKGKTWQHISKGSGLSHWANDFAFHPKDPDGIYVVSASPQGINAGGVYYTKDGGKKWWHILKDRDIARLLGEKQAYDHWMSVLVHPEKTNIIFAGATNHGLFFSANGGRSWKWCKEFPFSNAQSMAINPRNTDELIVTTFGSGVWSCSIEELLSRYNISYEKIK